MAAAAISALVLGVGGNVSQGIVKSLRLAATPYRIVGACVEPGSAGLYLCDQATISPLARSAEFPGWLVDTCRAREIDVILSGAEPVLDAIAPIAADLRRSCGAVAVCSPPEVLEVGGDKLRTSRWLSEQGLSAPATVDPAEPGAVERLVEQVGFPLIAKPRRGKGGAEILTIADQAGLDALRAGTLGARDEQVLQQHLGADAEEFTVGCVSGDDGRPVASIALRRELSAGTTYRAEAGDFPEIRSAAVEIAERLRPTGPLNVQLRLLDGRPVPFEFNIRFSGTSPIRARFGFNEVDAVVRHLLRGERIDLPLVTDGRALRYWNEIYPEADAFAELSREGATSSPRAVVEDAGMHE